MASLQREEFLQPFFVLDFEPMRRQKTAVCAHFEEVGRREEYTNC